MDSKTLPNKGTQKGDMRKSYFWRPLWQKIPPKTTFSSIFHDLRELHPQPSRTMKGDYFMEAKPRVSIGQSQEPPPSDAERSTEEQEDLGTFEELLAEADEIDKNLPFKNTCHIEYT